MGVSRRPGWRRRDGPFHDAVEELAPAHDREGHRHGQIKYLLVALDESVEQDVDKAWEGSPSNAFLYNALAQTMCMAAVHAVIPEVQDAGCAPAPKPTATLREALEAEGIPYSNDKDPILSRRYAVVTHYPFKGGCEICVLQSNCPKGQGQMEATSVVLPGYEHPQQM